MEDAELTGRSSRVRQTMRGLSEQVVLEAILAAGPITRPEISVRTKLSKPTVSEAIRRLMQERLIRSAGLRSGSPGRSPVSYVVDDAAGHVVGVDIGGSYVRVGAANLFGELLSKRREPQASPDPVELAKQVSTMVVEMVRATAATHSQALAVAVSLPNSWHRGPAAESLLSLLRERVGVQVISDSHLNLNAIGEKWRGFGAGISDFVFLSVGAECGAGIVVGDELVRGNRLSAGNIEVMLDLPLRDASGPRPLGGGMSADAMLLQARQLEWREGVPTTIEDVFARADREPSARRLISMEARRVAFVGAAICALLDPELLVLGGGIGSHPELHAEVQELLAGMLSEPPRLETSLLRDEAALFGAIATGLRAAHDRLITREASM
jgi:predicted NBD/HSP70 family sugar kinase